jgi:hypothetical protein
MKQTTSAQIVTASIELEFVGNDSEVTSIPAELVFDPADPFAVTMVCQTAEGEVLWTFGRELLMEGRHEPVGDGDVHVWPCLSSDGVAVVIVELCSPDGEVLVQTGTRAVEAFVTAMLSSVPAGQESVHLDFDDELAELLAS